MDYQQRQFSVKTERDSWNEDRNFDVEVQHNTRAIGEHFLDLNRENATPIVSNKQNAEDIKMLTPEDMGLIEKETANSNDTDKIDFATISNVRGDKLDDKAVEQIIACEKELNNDGDAEKFYNNVIKMKRSLLKNNYGRVIGEKVV